MATWSLLITYPAKPRHREIIESELPDGFDVSYLDDLDRDDVPSAIAAADALLTWAPDRELGEGGFDHLHPGQVVQAVTAGVDHLPLDQVPDGVTLLSNAGAYAEPMAEHVLALYFALSKRLLVEHRKLEAGEFDQFKPNRWVAGSTCGIVGFGAVGQAVARLLKRLDVSIMAINRRGVADEPVEFLGTPNDLETVLRTVDGLVLAAPLTPATRGLIDRKKLTWMADNGMLINVARGELVDQGDLYEHLRANPEFQAALEAWWVEPVRHGEFDLEYPLFDLPNVLGCPHNSAQVPETSELGQRHAVNNLVDALVADEPMNVVDPDRGY